MLKYFRGTREEVTPAPTGRASKLGRIKQESRLMPIKTAGAQTRLSTYAS